MIFKGPLQLKLVLDCMMLLLLLTENNRFRMDMLHSLKLVAKIFAGRKITKKRTFCKYARIFSACLRGWVCMPNREEIILLCSLCLWSDPRSLNESHRVCTEDLTNTTHFRAASMCCIIVSICAATLKAEIGAFKSLNVADMLMSLSMPCRNTLHGDWTAHVAVDPGVTLEKHLFFFVVGNY